MPAKRTHVCPHIDKRGRSCPNLTPCPIHARDRNRSWSPQRDRAAQARLRAAALQRDGFTCTRCPHHDPTGRTLHVHHVRPGMRLEDVITVCRPCHRSIDTHAR